MKNNDIGQRVRQIRKSDRVNLTLLEFGLKLGVAKATISGIESGNNNLTKPMKIAICREFSVNEKWLETGEGEMFDPPPRDALDMLAETYQFDSYEREIFRELFEDFFKSERREIIERLEVEMRVAKVRRYWHSGNSGTLWEALSTSKNAYDKAKPLFEWDLGQPQKADTSATKLESSPVQPPISSPKDTSPTEE